MCLEGGCGACIVSVQSPHSLSARMKHYSVNSCLVPIFACHGWSITTVEGIGSKDAGYHQVQKRLAAGNGTQCGYCTPGMIMNMYSLLCQNPKITMKEVEDSFGGNICRCTGYRPILDAFKSLASDAPKELTQKLADIEDLMCPKLDKTCEGKCGQTCHTNYPLTNVTLPTKSLRFQLKDNGAEWYRPSSKKEVFEIFDMIEDKTYRLVAGNTGHGVYREEEAFQVYIDINGVSELHGFESKSDVIELGANINLTEAMNLFYDIAKAQPLKYEYCKTLADHIDLIANVPVRNIGTFAGNLMMKHRHREFPSDIFLFLETVGAVLIIEELSGIEKTMELLQYLESDMNKKLITKIILPAHDSSVYIIQSYKIMPRAQNAHAYVNAGFMVKVDKKDKFRVTERPTILFGGISPLFLHADKTEDYLEGKCLMDNSVLKGALESIESQLHPDHILPDASPAYRKGLAQSLFYKFVLSLNPDAVRPSYRSGGFLLDRPLSSGKQEFDTDRNIWPLNKPIPKIEALIQCSGEAEYTNDVPNLPNELWGQLVLCDKAVAELNKIDPSEALKIPGVVAFFTAKDIPGKNNFVPIGFFYTEPEPVFVENKTMYAGQAVGVIVAESHSLAIKASKKVHITYGKCDSVLNDARKIINENITSRIKEYAKIEPKEKKDNVKYKIKGMWDIKSQYHYTMETLSCVAIPTEDGLDVYPATQWPASVQEAISEVLAISENSINIRVRRLGGAYGAKISRTNHTSVVAALAAYLLHRPIRMVLNMETNMEWAGKRFPVLSNYEAGVSDTGEIQYLGVKIYQDEGHAANDSAIYSTIHHFPNAYNSNTWTVTGYGVKTDSACNTWCRSPGSTEAICLIENIMEHIAKIVKKDPIEVRLSNMTSENNPLPQMILDMKKSSDYDTRVAEIQAFNDANRWKKRGISMVVMNYPFDYYGNFYAMVSIFGNDGTVAISHGGIEMGQGLNTKAAQVAAYILGIDLEMISIKPTTTLISPNNMNTGGSFGSESVAYAVKTCCEELNQRLQPTKDKLGPKASWEEVIKTARNDLINLNCSYMFTKRDNVKAYPIYGIGVTEVEIDLLTGQYHTKRVDLMEDAGQSMSPEVDVGQVEGAFVMGLGYFTSEELIYMNETGSLLTNRTWNYKPPGCKDIPIDFRVTLRKNSVNPVGVLRSKATGEPPLCMSCSVVFAIRNAVESGRRDSGQPVDDWFMIEQPCTAERIWLGSLNKIDAYKLS
ncbi:hypothetical protein AAG570_000335 [Ranatra chinensis]|uniref:Indole-3-acetaldehyde oxidase n=1 Tax=Ranatra chinensis TaxID=642074 RepID=A0ABD0YWR6_9HEMI